MSGYYERITKELQEDQETLRVEAARPSATRRSHRESVNRAFELAIAVLLAAGLLSYIGDYAVLRYRVASQKSPFGTATVQPYYAVHLKSGRTEFSFEPQQQERCANSLFPHLGLNPCWYLRRHPDRRTDI